MSMRRLWLPAAAIFLSACATSAVAPVPAPLPPSATTLDAAEFRRELDEAYGQIVARENAADAPAVDFEAAASFEVPQHHSIDGAVELFSTRMKDSIQTSLLRSAKYRTMIDRALEENELPKGFAYLPVIESAYVPTLTSRAGAHGIWQFMPDTAREYGLRVDWWVDERADPERSTRAAAKYLKDLYRRFGDWSLVLAAYNAGPGRVQRALEKADAGTFWELLEQAALPKETRGYVPTFWATLIIASDPDAYGFRLTNPIEADARRIELEGPLSLRFLAAESGVKLETLRELNPALRRGMLPPGRATVNVPSSAAAPLIARAKTLHHDDDSIEVCSYTLRGRDSLERLAEAVGTKSETILAMNSLSSAGRVRSGQTLYLPVRARELGALLRDAPAYYKVKKGDTLYAIAKRHGLTTAELRDLNDLPSKATLKPGQKLRVNAPKSVAAGGM